MSKLTLSFKGKPLKVIPLEEGEMVIGSDPVSPIHIDSLAVQPRHASVTVRGAQSVLRDLGTPDGTFVNGQRLSGDYLLRDNDNIRVGKHNLIYTHEVTASMPQAAPEPADSGLTLEAINPPKGAWLQILNGQNVGKTIGLNKNLVNLGKPGVQTAVIARRNEGYFLSHLEGEHSPLVNGAGIGDRSHHLQDGDTIQIGNIKMQFYLQ